MDLPGGSIRTSIARMPLHHTKGPKIGRTDRKSIVDVNGKKLLVVGDRVLVTPEVGEDRTSVGLLLPQSAVDKMQVQSGRVVEVGPGTPVPSPTEFNDEPWKLHEGDQKAHYVPMEAKVGDTALFLRNASVEIEFEDVKYLLVPHGAILMLVRGDKKADPESDSDEDIDLSEIIKLDD